MDATPPEPRAEKKNKQVIWRDRPTPPTTALDDAIKRLPKPKIFDRRKKARKQDREARTQDIAQPKETDLVNTNGNIPTQHEHKPDPVDAQSIVNRIIQSEKNSAPYSQQEGGSMYAHMVDTTSPESKAQTMGAAAEAARTDARRLSGQADEFRAQAAALDDKPGMSAQAEEFRAQARRLDDDSQQRTGMARAYDEAAIQFTAERAQ